MAPPPVQQRQEKEISSISQASSTLELDTESVLSNVLENMPLQKVLELRRVNRLWRSLLESDYFMKKWEQKHRGCVVMARRTGSRLELLACDGGTEWGRLKPPKRMMRFTDLKATWEQRREFVMVQSSSSSLGLLCFVYKQDMGPIPEQSTQYYSVHLLNPLTGSHAVLPVTNGDIEIFREVDRDFFRHKQPNVVYTDEFEDLSVFRHSYSCRHLDMHYFLQPDVDESHVHTHYRFFLFNQCRKKLKIYSSRSRSWTSASAIDSRSLSRQLPQPLSDLDFLHLYREHRSVLTYSSRSDSWIVLDVSPILSNVDGSGPATVFRHGERLVLAVVKPQNEAASFSVFEMQPSSGDGENYNWTEIARTPAHYLKGGGEQRGHSQRFNIVYGDGLVIMSTIHEPIAGSTNPRCCTTYESPLVYDMESGRWYKRAAPPPMPPPPPPVSGHRFHSPFDFSVAWHQFIGLCTLRPSFKPAP